MGDMCGAVSRWLSRIVPFRRGGRTLLRGPVEVPLDNAAEWEALRRAHGRRRGDEESGAVDQESTSSQESSDEEDTPKRRPSLVLVRALSGEVVAELSAGETTPVSKLVRDVGNKLQARSDSIQLVVGGDILCHSSKLGDNENVLPFLENSETIDVMCMRLQGPPVRVESTSGRTIEALEGLPPLGTPGACHCDRSYRFLSMGEFAAMDEEKVRYIRTSNDDKAFPAEQVMWKLEFNVNCMVYLNFRSEAHVNTTGADIWLRDLGWTRSAMVGTTSSGFPNGPYRGPVFTKEAASGSNMNLMGSNCSEGTYFVFVELKN